MDSVFRKDVFGQETSSFFKQCFTIPKFLEVKYNLPLEEQQLFKKELLNKNNVNVNLPLIDNKKFLLETFMKGCFKKCKQFILDDYVDFDEVDCTMKCANKTKESYQLLENILIPNSSNNN